MGVLMQSAMFDSNIHNGVGGPKMLSKGPRRKERSGEDANRTLSILVWFHWQVDFQFNSTRMT